MDSNVLVALYSTDKAKEAKRSAVEGGLKVFSQFKDLKLCSSMWAVTAMVDVLVSTKKMDCGQVAEIESQLVSERRLVLSLALGTSYRWDGYRDGALVPLFQDLISLNRRKSST